MIVNELDKRISNIFQNPEATQEDFQKFKTLLGDLNQELKSLWNNRDSAKTLVEDVIDYCLDIIESPLGTYEWDEMKADQLIMLFDIAGGSRELREAASWASYSRNPEIRVLFTKHEIEQQMFFLNDSLENLDGMAFRLLTWLNARNSLINSYRNR